MYVCTYMNCLSLCISIYIERDNLYIWKSKSFFTNGMNFLGCYLTGVTWWSNLLSIAQPWLFWADWPLWLVRISLRAGRNLPIGKEVLHVYCGRKFLGDLPVFLFLASVSDIGSSRWPTSYIELLLYLYLGHTLMLGLWDWPLDQPFWNLLSKYLLLAHGLLYSRSCCLWCKDFPEYILIPPICLQVTASAVEFFLLSIFWTSPCFRPTN